MLSSIFIHQSIKNLFSAKPITLFCYIIKIGQWSLTKCHSKCLKQLFSISNKQQQLMNKKYDSHFCYIIFYAKETPSLIVVSVCCICIPKNIGLQNTLSNVKGKVFRIFFLLWINAKNGLDSTLLSQTSFFNLQKHKQNVSLCG